MTTNARGCFGKCVICDLDFEANMPIDWTGYACSHCGSALSVVMRDGKPLEETPLPRTQLEKLLLVTTTSAAYLMRSQADRKYVYRHLLEMADEGHSDGKLTAAEADLVRSKVEEYWAAGGIRDREYKALSRVERRARAA